MVRCFRSYSLTCVDSAKQENKENCNYINQIQTKEFVLENPINQQKQQSLMKKSNKTASTAILSSTLQTHAKQHNNWKEPQKTTKNNISINKSTLMNPSSERSEVSTPSTYKLKNMFSTSFSTDSNFKSRLEIKSTQRKTPDSVSSNAKAEKSLESDRVVKTFETFSIRQSNQDIKACFRSLLNPAINNQNSKATLKNEVENVALSKTIHTSKTKGSLKNSFTEKYCSPRSDLDSAGLHKKLESSKTKSKSSERAKDQKQPKDRKLDKNFSSFTQNTLQDEETDNIFKSYTIVPRARTANPSFVEEPTSLLKGIVSPKLNKTPINVHEKQKSMKKTDTSEERRINYSNPLKFLNDFIQKTKISHSSSSNHLKMPKPSTFTESKLQQGFSRGNSKNKYSEVKTDKTKNPLWHQGINPHNYTTFTSAKRLFGTKPSK